MSASMNPFEHDIVPSTTRSNDVAQSDIGGKARNLLLLREAGFDIPDWWVVSSRVFDNAIQPVRQTIVDLLKQTSFDDVADIDRATEAIRELVLTLRPPEEILHQLRAYLARDARAKTFAVRSSVRDEDGAKHSFAGLMESFLNQRSEDLRQCIPQVWASAFSSRALAYRWKKGIDLRGISAAVVIQEMIPAKSAGVLFTHEPNNLQETCIITAAIGLGEGVTSDIVDTDTYQVGWHSSSIRKQISRKTTKVAGRDEGGTAPEAVSPEAQQLAVLSDDQIHALCKLAIQASAAFGAPLDIEWAFDDEDRCWFLQARPIVPAERPRQVRIWDNANIVESYPGLTLPLTFSFAREHYERTFRQLALTAFRLRHSYWERHPVFRNLFGLIHGRVYLNLLSWYQMLSFLPGFKQRKSAWDQMFGIEGQLDPARAPLSLVDHAGVVVVVAKTLLTVKSGNRNFEQWFQPIYDRFKSNDLASLDECELAETYQQLAAAITKRWHLTLRNDFCAMTYYDWLQKLCRRWASDENPNLHNDLLRGQTHIESVAPSRSIDRLADMLKGHDGYNTLVSLKDESTILARIREDNSFSEFKHAFDLHIDRFGDRSVEELKLEVPSFREQPERVIEMIMGRVNATQTIDQIEARAKGARRQSELSVRRYIRNPLKRAMLKLVLSNARRALANRESMRLARGRVYGLVRRIFGNLGVQLEKKGFLESSRDIFYLTVGEIMDFINGTAATEDMRATVKLRRDEYASFEKLEPPGRFQTTGLVYDNVPTVTMAGEDDSNEATGIGCSSGTASGAARIIRDPANAVIKEGDIIVARSTDPAWVYLMTACRGIVVERGSVLSHTSIIGRELGIPTIVGVAGATERIPEQATVTIDGQTGRVQWR